MTGPIEVRDQFLHALESAHNHASAMFDNLFRLCFLFPAIVGVLITQLAMKAYVLAFREPAVTLQFPKKEIAR